MKKISFLILISFSLNSQAGPCVNLVHKANGEYNKEQFEVSYKTSQEAIKACTTENVRSAPAHVLAGASKLRQGQYQMAVNEFLIAEKIDPKSEIIQKNLCSAYSMLKDDKNSDKYCGINQPQPKTAPEKNCHFPNQLEDLKTKWAEALPNCKNKPILNLGFSSPTCGMNMGGEGGGGNYYLIVEHLSEILNDVCAERPEALATVKAINLKEAQNFETQSVKVLKTSIEANVLVGRWNETLFLTKSVETQTKIKQDLRKIFAVKLQTEDEKNKESEANLNKVYDAYNVKHKELNKKQSALVEQKNKVSLGVGVGIGKIWSSPGDPTKKAAEAEVFQKKSDAEIEAFDKQIQATHDELEKLTADYEKSQAK